MTWTRLSDDFYDKPEILTLSDAAFRAHVTALVWCNKHTTDGYLPHRMQAVLSVPNEALTELQAAGLWLDLDTGWQVDWSDQEPAERVRRDRAFRAEKQRRYRDRVSRHNAGDHSACDPRRCPAVTRNATDNETGNVSVPVPSRPVPSEGQGQGQERRPVDAVASPTASEGSPAFPQHPFAPDDSGVTCTVCGTGPNNRRHQGRQAVA